MGSILIRGAKLADPEKICCERLDLLCRNGVIEKIEKNIQDPADKTVDAQSLALLPGLVDMHVHLRDPGLTYKEDVFTGCRRRGSDLSAGYAQHKASYGFSRLGGGAPAKS